MAVALVLIVSACTVASTPTPQATPSPTTAPTTNPDRTPSAECFNPPPDILALINQTDPVACYGGAALTVGAHVFVLGGAIHCPGGLQPAWFSCESWIQLEPLGETAEAPFLLAALQGPFMFAALDPASGLKRNNLAILAKFNALITGHYDDPAAQLCHITAWPVGAGAPPAASEVIDGCRGTFVVTTVVPPGS